jgi:ABC-type multidrug transport system fused ATPase/permease subunit
MLDHLKTLHKLWNILRVSQKYFYRQFVFIVISQILVITSAILSGQLLTTIATKHWDVVMSVLAIYFLVSMVDIFFTYLSGKNRIHHLEETLMQSLQEFSLKRILSLTISQHIEEHSALKLSIINKGEQATKNIIDTIITSFIPTFTLLTISCITLAIISPILGGFCLFVFIILFFWSYQFQKGHFPYLRTNRENWNDQSRHRQEAFTHLQLIKFLARESYFIKTFLARRAKKIEHHLFTVNRANDNRYQRITVTEIFVTTTLATSIYLFSIGALAIGTIYTVLNIINRIYWNISALSNSMRELPQLYADVEKYLSVIEKVPTFEEGGRERPLLIGDIIFSNISFVYPHSERPLFENTSFIIPHGKTTAFVGESGSGKSTIVKILLRAYDYGAGSITLNNVELRTIDIHYLREHIGYVEQHVDLLDDTVEENILLGVKEKDRKDKKQELETIAQKARIDRFYNRLGDKKFNTVVGERGIKLSGGERQRIGIARAIIKDPEILIFDEATSALDTENEKYVMDAINDVSKGKTTIIIAHRLSTIRNADKIIVMDKGTIVGEGTHEELLAGNSFYQNLVSHQL